MNTDHVREVMVLVPTNSRGGGYYRAVKDWAGDERILNAIAMIDASVAETNKRLDGVGHRWLWSEDTMTYTYYLERA